MFAQVNRTTIEGKYTALHLAAFHRHHRCVETLLMERGGRFLNLGAINADGKTALQLAHEKGYYDIVRLIRSGGRYQEKKINIAFPSKENKTSLPMPVPNP